MPRPAPSLLRLPAILVAFLALLAPLADGDAGAKTGSATSAAPMARAAQHDERPAAERFPVDSPSFHEARQIAETHWGAAACKGQINVSWKAMEEGINATATWRNPTDAWNNPAENFDCVVELNTAADYDFAKLCTVLTHEIGHLHGRPHADQAGDLMSPLYSEPTPACRQAAPPAPADEPVELEDDAAAGAEATASADRRAAKKRTGKRASLRKAADKRRCLRTMKASKGAKAAKAAKRTPACSRVARQAKRTAVKR